MRTHLYLAGLVVSLVLGGCGVTFKATQVDLERSAHLVEADMKAEGITYALPRTVLTLSQPVTLLNLSGGYFRSWGACHQACSLGRKLSDENIPKSLCKVDTSSKLLFGRPTVTTASEPDPGHFYRVTVTPGLLATVSHKFVIGAGGVLEETENSASNMTYELVTSVLQTAASIASVRTLPAATDHPGAVPQAVPLDSGEAKRSAPPAAEESQKTFPPAPVGEADKARCLESQATLKGIFEKLPSDSLPCDWVDEIVRCTKASHDKAEQARMAWHNALKTAEQAKSHPATLQFIDARHKAMVAEAEAAEAEDLAAYGAGDRSFAPIPYVLTVPLGAPSEFAEMKKPLELNEKKMKEAGAVLGSTHEAAEKNRETIFAALSPYSLDVVVRPKDEKRLECKVAEDKTPKKCGPAAEGGYRYRLPALGRVTVKLMQEQEDAKEADEKAETKTEEEKTENKTKVEKLHAFQEIPVAQYGWVGTLPSEFHGKGGSLNVKLDPATGTLREVVVGAEALPTTAATGIVDKVKERVEARRAADPELAALKREADMAELRKKIRDANNPTPPAPAE